MTTKALRTAKRVAAHCTMNELSALSEWAGKRRLALAEREEKRKKDEAWERLKHAKPGEVLYALRSSGTFTPGCATVQHVHPRKREIVVLVRFLSTDGKFIRSTYTTIDEDKIISWELIRAPSHALPAADQVTYQRLLDAQLGNH